MEERRKKLRRETDRRMADRRMADRLKGKSVEEAADYLKRQRRRAIRHRCIAKITVDIVAKAGADGEWKGRTETIKARVLDLSEAGASIFASVPLSTGQQTRIQIYLPDGSFIESTAEVRWTKENDSRSGFAAGLRFTQIAPLEGAKVRAFLDELDRTLGL